MLPLLRCINQPLQRLIRGTRAVVPLGANAGLLLATGAGKRKREIEETAAEVRFPGQAFCRVQLCELNIDP